ncbi:type I-E CRISPR-associated protein Cse2/CasB [Actinophytocola sp.]|uniref:type I-E CRISPR-associated protein Cse2/CasB n=1 Tax=Actinophytocola sp. TaxID=1872138 RepID=UPI003D6B07A6
MTYTVKSVVDKKIWDLQNGYVANRSGAVAALARLRRGVGKPAGSVLDILEFTYAPELVGDPRDDDPTPGEVAAHLCLTLYAVHQQSQRQRMHQRGRPLGRSIRALIPPDHPDYTRHPVARRFAMLGTADSLAELEYHLRGMVQLLHTNTVPLDYGQLAVDLLRWQCPGGAPTVRLWWGRDFHHLSTPAATSDTGAVDGAVESAEPATTPSS